MDSKDSKYHMLNFRIISKCYNAGMHYYAGIVTHAQARIGIHMTHK